MNFTVALVDNDEIIPLINNRLMRTSNFHKYPKSFNSAEQSWGFFVDLPEQTRAVLLFLDINIHDINDCNNLDIMHHDYFDKKISVVMITSSIEPCDHEKTFSFAKVIDFISKAFTICLLQKILPEDNPCIKEIETENVSQ